MDLRNTVLVFRKGLLNGRDSDNCCFMVCAPLQGYLSFLGVQTKLVEGRFLGTHHFWLEKLDGTVIDPTIDQFQKEGSPIKLPKVYIGPRKDWYSD